MSFCVILSTPLSITQKLRDFMVKKLTYLYAYSCEREKGYKLNYSRLVGEREQGTNILLQLYYRI